MNECEPQNLTYISDAAECANGRCTKLVLLFGRK